MLYLMYPTPSKRRNVIGGLTEELFMKNRINISVLLKLFETQFFIYIFFKFTVK